MSQVANTTMEDCLANGTISIKVPNMEVFDDEGRPRQIMSTVEKIGGIAWRMKIRKVLKPSYLKLLVYCNEDVKEHLWLCKVQFKVETWANGVDKPIHTSSYSQFYGFNSYYRILTTPIPGISANQTARWPIEVKLFVKICYVMENSFPPLDTNLVVNMGEDHSETLLINKNSLASLSSYFHNLFFGDWVDKKKKDGNYFELHEPEDFNFVPFKIMIYAAMTLGFMVHESNFLNHELALGIVRLAIKFDVPMLLDCCEQFLLTIKHSMMDTLELADQFNLARLKEHCLNEMSVIDFMEDFSKNTGVHSRLSKATLEKLREKLGEKAKELRDSTVDLHTEVQISIRNSYNNNAMARSFNKMAKVALGESASKVKY